MDQARACGLGTDFLAGLGAFWRWTLADRMGRRTEPKASRRS